MSEIDERTRIDKWLWAARFFKTRSLAAQAVDAGRVTLNGERTKPSKGLHVGDALRIQTPVVAYTVKVIALADKRGSATIAAGLYAETEASRKEREQAREGRRDLHPASTLRGRPTKRVRRQLERLHEGGDE